MAFVAAALLVLYIRRNVLALAALAGLIAFLVAPAIRFLHDKWHVPRLLALLTSYVAVFICLVAMSFLMVDGVVGAVSDIDIDEAEESLRSTAQDWLTNVREIHVAGYTIDLSDSVDPLIEDLDGASSSSGDSSGSDTGSSDDAKRLSVDSDELQNLFGGLTSSVGAVGSSLLAAFMSGIITVLVAIYLNVWIVGLPGAFVFAIILAVLNMIPTFGPILAAIRAVLAALTLGSSKLDWSNVTFALLAGALYLVVVQLQANLVAPLITGRAVKLSPATDTGPRRGPDRAGRRMTVIGQPSGWSDSPR